MEKRKKLLKEEVLEYEVLNLLTDTGLRSVQLDEISSIRILDERLDKELKDALAVVAAGLDNQRKPVIITFTGKGERHVVVGYLNETPVWKTSYRLIFQEGVQDKALLQGWAIVENTSDADWTNIHLSLISGRPISFIEDLYSPLYIPRPVVQPNIFASIKPVMYGGDLLSRNIPQDEAKAKADRSYNDMNEALPPPAMSAAAPGARRSATPAEAARMTVASAAAASDLGKPFSTPLKIRSPSRDKNQLYSPSSPAMSMPGESPYITLMYRRNFHCTGYA